jgi:hypothetical protein
MGDRLAPGLGDSLDRVDNGGNHEPATWIGRPPAKQDRNRRRWLPSNQVIGDGLASRLGALDSRRQTGIATTVAGAGRAGGYLSSGRLASPPRERPRRGRVLLPHTGPLLLPIYLAWAALQLPGVEVEEVPM